MKINGRVAASTFSSDSKKVYASSGKLMNNMMSQSFLEALDVFAVKV